MMPYKDPSAEKRYQNNYKKIHGARLRDYAKGYRKSHPETNQRYNRNVKKRLLTHYGKLGQLQCCWKNCKVVDLDILTLDHVNNNGFEDRRAWGKGGSSFYRHIISLGFPIGFQTLCANHQLKKEILRRRKHAMDIRK